ncbi:hypothetical protein Tco_1183652 [Tanacetum coccineum]
MTGDSPNDPTIKPSLSNILNKSVFIQSPTIIGHDGRVQSYCGLKLADIPASGPGIPAAYHNLGPPSYECPGCHAIMWYEKRNDKAKRVVNPTFSLCCQEAKIDHSINTGRGPYTFRINGQNYHRMGSLLPAEGVQPSRRKHNGKPHSNVGSLKPNSQVIPDGKRMVSFKSFKRLWDEVAFDLLRDALSAIFGLSELKEINNYDNESSDDNNDDDDVEKDEEDEEEEEHLAPTDPSVETMTIVDQGMSVEEIERVVAQRVANAIEAIAIDEMKTNMARKSMSQTEQPECKVADNANNKRKNPTAVEITNSPPVISVEVCDHFISKCPNSVVAEYENKKIRHSFRRLAVIKEDVESHFHKQPEPTTLNKRQYTGQKDYAFAREREKKYYGGQGCVLNATIIMMVHVLPNATGHYKRDCPERKNQSHKNQTGGTRAHGVVHTLRGEETDQDPNNIKDEIKA